MMLTMPVPNSRIGKASGMTSTMIVHGCVAGLGLLRKSANVGMPPVRGIDRQCRQNSSVFELGMGMERVEGIEPSSKAWEAFVLPLNYTRAPSGEIQLTNKLNPRA